MNQTLSILGKTTLSVALTVSPLGLSAQKKTVSGQKSPNLLIIMADQWRGQALEFLGEEQVKTPHLNRMASEGVVFNQAVSSYPVSSPARAMLMTGMYPLSNKVVLNCNATTAPWGVELEKEAVCWSDILKRKGYDLGYIGKWHLDAPIPPHDLPNGTWNEWCPPDKRHGFDYWLAYGTYAKHLNPIYWDTDAPRDGYFFVDQWGPEYEAEKAIDYILNKDGLRDTENAFALVVSMNPPHTRYSEVPQRYKDMYKEVELETLCQKPNIPAGDTKMGKHYRENIKNYYACMTGVDEQIGRIISALKENALFDNTIVVFTSDHGNCLGIHGQETKNNYYEESMRIPMIITWPEQLKPRRDDDVLISFADLFPTLLTMMGYEKDIPETVETRNLAKAVRTGKDGVDYQPYFKYGTQQENIRTHGFRGIRTKQHTYILEYQDGQVVDLILFDRKSDPYQLYNIAGRDKKLERQLRKYLKQALKDAKDELADTL